MPIILRFVRARQRPVFADARRPHTGVSSSNRRNWHACRASALLNLRLFRYGFYLKRNRRQGTSRCAPNIDRRRNASVIDASHDTKSCLCGYCYRHTAAVLIEAPRALGIAMPVVAYLARYHRQNRAQRSARRYIVAGFLCKWRECILPIKLKSASSAIIAANDCSRGALFGFRQAACCIARWRYKNCPSYLLAGGRKCRHHALLAGPPRSDAWPASLNRRRRAISAVDFACMSSL